VYRGLFPGDKEAGAWI